ncbi:hypothetical protein AVEN_135423-1 [Araneus ventricosus]|uniref:Uncharacterized protein n=1 Tax=Araneus ventricosus TaxID=182803 RepID=A0A4Y2BCL9_ARAVE|nr:hypothetical protein AVEN_135423-1 [Araneus ventricosus]
MELTFWKLNILVLVRLKSRKEFSWAPRLDNFLKIHAYETPESQRKMKHGLHSKMRACWQNTAGYWYEKLLLHGTRVKQAPDEGNIYEIDPQPEMDRPCYREEWELCSGEEMFHLGEKSFALLIQLGRSFTAALRNPSPSAMSHSDSLLHVLVPLLQNRQLRFALERKSLTPSSMYTGRISAFMVVQIKRLDIQTLPHIAPIITGFSH